MYIYAISDLHLSGVNPKPMDVFGPHWDNHWEKIKESWRAKVRDEDIVLIPGDISWAMELEEAKVDLYDIGRLPGRKILIRGNHDYWWSSISKVRRILPDNMTALQNDSVCIQGIAFCGTRGWTAPGPKDYTEHDEKVFARELIRLRMSLESAKDSGDIIVLLHYPPFNDKGKPTAMVELLKSWPVKHVVFGHLHGESLKSVTEGCFEGIQFHLVSCDYLNFEVKPIMEL